MKNTMTHLNFVLIASISLLLAAGNAMAQDPVKVSAYAEHYGGKLVYHYRVSNSSPYNVAVVTIGYDTQNDTDNYNDVWELFELPSGWDSDTGIPPASVTSPTGWRAYVITLEETEWLGINWKIIDDNSPRLLPGQTFTGMSVTLDKADVNYINGHATIIYSNKPYPVSLTIPIERLDNTPPILTVTLSPNILRNNEKLTAITTTITVKDDYDSQPEIKLESITANEVLEKEDIKGALIGTDDRQFMLKAEREGKSKAGRIYTVTYSATDGSGNKSVASATVTVPHDERESEGRDSDDKKRERHDDKDKSDSKPKR
jgi:hypothetical protein